MAHRKCSVVLLVNVWCWTFSIFIVIGYRRKFITIRISRSTVHVSNVCPYDCSQGDRYMHVVYRTWYIAFWFMKVTRLLFAAVYLICIIDCMQSHTPVYMVLTTQCIGYHLQPSLRPAHVDKCTSNAYINYYVNAKKVKCKMKNFIQPRWVRNNIRHAGVYKDTIPAWGYGSLTNEAFCSCFWWLCSYVACYWTHISWKSG